MTDPHCLPLYACNSAVITRSYCKSARLGSLAVANMTKWFTVAKKCYFFLNFHWIAQCTVLDINPLYIDSSLNCPEKEYLLMKIHKKQSQLISLFQNCPKWNTLKAYGVPPGAKEERTRLNLRFKSLSFTMTIVIVVAAHVSFKWHFWSKFFVYCQILAFNRLSFYSILHFVDVGV